MTGNSSFTKVHIKNFKVQLNSKHWANLHCWFFWPVTCDIKCVLYMDTDVSYEYMASVFRSENLCLNLLVRAQVHSLTEQFITGDRGSVLLQNLHTCPQIENTTIRTKQDMIKRRRMGKSYRKCNCECGTTTVLSVILILYVSSHQTFTQEVLTTGFGPTGNTILDTIDCTYSHQPHNNIIT